MCTEVLSASWDQKNKPHDSFLRSHIKSHFMFMFEADFRFTNITRYNMLVTYKHPSRSGLRMHELCIAWSLIVRAGSPWRSKILISRPLYFTGSVSRIVNFLARPGISYSVRDVEVTVLSPNLCGNSHLEGHVLVTRACTLQIKGFWMTVSCCAGLHGTAS
jgi:hypothetical protein